MADDIVKQLRRQAQVTPLNEGRGTLTGAPDEIERLRRLLERAERLRRYVHHWDNCAVLRDLGADCTCGLTWIYEAMHDETGDWLWNPADTRNTPIIPPRVMYRLKPPPPGKPWWADPRATYGT